ncbi:hypothetical protein L218DRAFT_993813 [Marasmius fiardii PR-910]|nr:hypothetical protein L218DRAFT_993813 [Marasmius fiardii PR-910]
MALASSSLFPPDFPLVFNADVFSSILIHIGVRVEDMVFLWTTCREVSRGSKDAVERVFIMKHLKRTYLKIDAGESCYTIRMELYRKVSLATEYTFSHLDLNDRTRAIFRDKECHQDFKRLMRRTLKEIFEEGNPVDNPQVVIQIRREASDTLIPNLEFDWNNLEMKFDWMGMYSEWFKEEKEHARRVEEMVDGTGGLKVLALQMRQKVQNGEMDEMESFMVLLKSFAGGHEDTRKKLRAERIARNIRKQYGILDYDVEDDEEVTESYKKLKTIRHWIGFEDPYSDEEAPSEKGKAKDEEENEDDSDDWEDVDEDED